MNKFYKFLKALQPVLAALCVVTLFGLYFGSAEDMAQISLSGGTSKVSLGSVYALAFAKAADSPSVTVKGALIALLVFSAYLTIYAAINLAVKFSRRFEYGVTPFRDKKIYTRALFSALSYPIYAALLVCTAVAYGVITSAGLGLTVPGAGLTGALSIVTICFGLTIIAEVSAAVLRACDDGLKAQYSAKAREERQNKLRAAADKPVPPAFEKPEYCTLLNCARHTKRLRIFSLFYLPVPIIEFIYFIVMMKTNTVPGAETWFDFAKYDGDATLLWGLLFGIMLFAAICLVVSIVLTSVILRKKPATVEAASSRSTGALKVFLGVISWFVQIYIIAFTFVIYNYYSWLPTVLVFGHLTGALCVLFNLFAIVYFSYAAYVRRKKAKVLRKFFFGKEKPQVVSVENGVKKYNTNITDDKLEKMRLEYERVAEQLKEHPHEIYEYRKFWYDNVFPDAYGSPAIPRMNPSPARCYVRKHAAKFKALLGVTIILAVLLSIVISAMI